MRSILASASVLALASAALAQPTAFTYQGQIKNGTSLASGLHDLRFRLFDAPAGGAQIGTTQCLDNVSVANGLFAATIDFGQQFATPAPRFLEIEVRADTGLNCSNTTGFVILSPRQALTATPLANSAKSAFSLAAPDGAPANAVFVDNDGKVGVGTTAPTHTIHIASTGPTLAIQDTDSTTQQVGYVDYRDSSNVSQGWVGFGSAGDPDFSIVNARPSGDIVLSTLGGGNVGIGTASPTSLLHVAGAGTFNGPVTATAFTIASTLRSYTLHPYQLTDPTPGSGGIVQFHDDTGLQVFGNLNEFATSVHLPDGATVVMFEVYGHDGSSSVGSDITARLGRTSLSGSPLTMALVSSSSGGSIWSTTGILSPIVDNDTQSYWVRVNLGGGVPPADNTLTGIRILYSITKPLP